MIFIFINFDEFIQGVNIFHSGSELSIRSE
nr:MAG TPA: hypothetical protein [Caudoviricetes sp.]